MQTVEPSLLQAQARRRWFKHHMLSERWCCPCFGASFGRALLQPAGLALATDKLWDAQEHLRDTPDASADSLSRGELLRLDAAVLLVQLNIRTVLKVGSLVERLSLMKEGRLRAGPGQGIGGAEL
jgi:hypothetical protein